LSVLTLTEEVLDQVFFFIIRLF